MQKVVESFVALDNDVDDDVDVDVDVDVGNGVVDSVVLVAVDSSVAQYHHNHCARHRVGSSLVAGVVASSSAFVVCSVDEQVVSYFVVVDE